MQIIVHRRNTIEELISTPFEYGVEIDIRSFGQRLIIHHEPFINALGLEEWIKYFRHNTLVLNVKEEGIEYKVKGIVEKHGIKNYFFLDLSFPTLVKMVDAGEKSIAIRFSEYESLETVMNFANKAEWVWVDCFTRMPLTIDTYSALSEYFKICIVSPELHGRDLSELQKFKQLLTGFQVDAVCTEWPNLWRQ